MVDEVVVVAVCVVVDDVEVVVVCVFLHWLGTISDVVSDSPCWSKTLKAATYGPRPSYSWNAVNAEPCCVEEALLPSPKKSVKT